MTKTLVGYGYTNAQGVATLDYDPNDDPIEPSGYHGTGAGHIGITAETVIDGSTLQETIPVIDGKFYDIGTTGTINPLWYYNLNNSFISTSTGLKFTNNSTTNYIISPNLTGKTSPTMSEMCVFEEGTRCEFDIVSKTGNVILQLRNVDGSWLAPKDLSSTTGTHVIWTYQNGQVTVTVDGTAIGNPSNQTGNVQLRIVVMEGYLEFKNFVVYSI